MEKDRIQEIKNAYKGMVDNSVILWNARLDLLGNDPDALEELLEEARGSGRPKPVPNHECPTNTVAGCGPTNTTTGCGQINTAKGCGPINFP